MIENHNEDIFSKLCESENIVEFESYLKGFDVNSKNKSGIPLLHFLVIQEKWDFINVLVTKYQADINIQDQASNSTPLMRAVLWDDPMVLEFLILLGADINLVTKSGNTVLHLAVSSEKTQSVLFFLDQKHDINIKNNYDQSPFQILTTKPSLLNNPEIINKFSEILYEEYEINYKKYRDISPILFRENFSKEKDEVKSLLEQADQVQEQNSGITMFPRKRLEEKLNNLNQHVNEQKIREIENKINEDNKNITQEKMEIQELESQNYSF